MAASFALGGVGLAGCRRPEANILPFGKSVEGFVPGLPVYYATAMPQRRIALPLLAETHQGRPTKLEGKPAYEPLGGATSLAAQASLLDLYDPDRATAHTQNGNALTAAAVADLLAGIGAAAAADQGASLAFLAERSPRRRPAPGWSRPCGRSFPRPSGPNTSRWPTSPRPPRARRSSAGR